MSCCLRNKQMRTVTPAPKSSAMTNKAKRITISFMRETTEFWNITDKTLTKKKKIILFIYFF